MAHRLSIRYIMALVSVLFLIQCVHGAYIETEGTLNFLLGLRNTFPSLVTRWPAENSSYCTWEKDMCDSASTVAVALYDLVAADGAALPEVTTDDVMVAGLTLYVDPTTPVTLPASWSRLSRLFFLDFKGGFTGELPVSWSNLSKLEMFSCTQCNLTGTLPSEWSTLPALTSMKVSGSPHLGGTLSDAWINASSLNQFFVDGSSLTGTLPASWGNWSVLSTLSLSANNLSGTLPVEWGTLPVLKSVTLSNNSFSGTLPNWNLSNLRVLELTNNELSGTLPSSWSAWPLTNVALSGNRFCGCEPDSWKNVTVLHNAAAQTPTSWVNCSLVNSCTPLPTLVLGDEDGASAHLSVTLTVVVLTALFVSFFLM